MAALPWRETSETTRLLDQVQRDLGLSDGEMATVLAVPVATIRHPGMQEAPDDSASEQHLRVLTELHGRLRESFAPEAAAAWLRAESRYLAGQRPVDALLSQRFDRVDAALGALEWGIFV